MSDVHVVLGATGGAGAAIIRALHQAGLDSRAVNRSGSAAVPEGVQRLAADITDADAVKKAVHGAAVVYMAAQPEYTRWPQEFPTMLDTVIAATGSAGAKLVMVDNLYGYGPVEGSMTEDTPEHARDTKGVVRVAMTTRLLRAHQTGEVRLTIGRASDYFGPGVLGSSIMALALEPLTKAGAAIKWAGRSDVAHSVAYVPDIARAFVTLGTDDRADGQIWHLPHAPAPTGEAFLTMVNDAYAALTNNTPRKNGRIGTTMLRLAAPFHAMSKEMLGIAYQYTQPYVVDDSRFRSTFDDDHTPLPQAVAATVGSMLGAAS